MQPSSELYFDFTSKQLQYRLQKASLAKEMLLRSVGLDKFKNLLVVDTTAGTGEDSMILAAFGAKVIMLERHKLVYSLLQDALSRFRDAANDIKNQRISAILNNMPKLIFTDAIDFLSNDALGKAPAITTLSKMYNTDYQAENLSIYMDPMFEGRSKSAKSRKEMAIFQDLVGADMDKELLFEAACKLKPNRVVVKNHINAPYIKNQKPNFSLNGSSTRFDVYVFGG